MATTVTNFIQSGYRMELRTDPIQDFCSRACKKKLSSFFIFPIKAESNVIFARVIWTKKKKKKRNFQHLKIQMLLSINKNKHFVDLINKTFQTYCSRRNLKVEETKTVFRRIRVAVKSQEGINIWNRVRSAMLVGVFERGTPMGDVFGGSWLVSLCTGL